MQYFEVNTVQFSLASNKTQYNKVPKVPLNQPHTDNNMPILLYFNISAPKANTQAVIPDPQVKIIFLAPGFVSLKIALKFDSDFIFPSSNKLPYGMLLEFGIRPPLIAALGSGSVP